MHLGVRGDSRLSVLAIPAGNLPREKRGHRRCMLGRGGGSLLNNSRRKVAIRFGGQDRVDLARRAVWLFQNAFVDRVMDGGVASELVRNGRIPPGRVLFPQAS